LIREQIPFDYRVTESPNHATEITTELLKNHCHRIAVFGGDGTLNEVLQGVFKDGIAPPREFQLLFFGGGSSCDFEKLFPRRRNYLDRLLHGETFVIDIGKVEFQGLEGERRVRYFVNNSSIGVISLATEKFNHAEGFARLMKKLNVDAGALVAGVQTLMEFDGFKCRLTIEGEQTQEFNLSNLTVFKSPYFAGGMNYGVQTGLDDGLLYVAVIDARSRLKMFRLIPSLYTGKIFQLEGTLLKRCTSLVLETDEKVFIDTDGEIIGYPPLKYSVLKRVLTVIM